MEYLRGRNIASLSPSALMLLAASLKRIARELKNQQKSFAPAFLKAGRRRQIGPSPSMRPRRLPAQLGGDFEP